MQSYKDISLGLSYDDVLLIPRYSEIESRSDIDLSTQITPRLKLKIPLISSNMSSITDVKFAIALGKLGGLGVLPRFMPAEDEANMVIAVKKEKVLVGAAVGVKKGEFERAKLLVSAGVDLLVLDVAHGHMQKTIETTKKLKQMFGEKVGIVSGNVVTYKAAKDLFMAGTDSVKVGIGPGSTCITRIETGCGVPQISAILDCAKAARTYKKTLICDGGMKNSGDVVKALAAGASAVMTGHLFAGLAETAGKIIIKNGKKYKEYNGSTSLIEKSKQSPNNVKHIEGVASYVPYKGELKPYIDRILENIRSGFSYVGAKNIKELWQKANFIRVSHNGLKENGHHDITVTQND
ncbi:MAG: guanosine monophosphate reductase [Patescibacteria group bacterium]